MTCRCVSPINGQYPRKAFSRAASSSAIRWSAFSGYSCAFKNWSDKQRRTEAGVRHFTTELLAQCKSASEKPALF